jgi:hypothetical protein
VTLSRSQLADILGILEKIDRGRIQPRFGDRIGRFLRQYASGRRELRAVLAQQSSSLRSDGAVSGKLLGAIEVHALIDPEVDVLAFPLGETASTLVVSEQLGGILNLRMWLKAGTAQATYDVLRDDSAVRLIGDYRWTPSAQVTPGEARIEPAGGPLSWRDARCLKAVADDLLRPPHAVEYVLDYRLGPPGLKFFRTICAGRANGGWQALPCFGQARTLKVCAAGVGDGVPPGDLLLLLAYREPWSTDWTIVRAVAIQPDEALAHALTWAHFRSELSGESFDAGTVTAAREALRAWGIKSSHVGPVSLDHQLLPVAKTLLECIRRTY